MQPECNVAPTLNTDVSRLTTTLQRRTYNARQFRNALPKEFVSHPSILLMQFNLTPLLCFLVYFHPNSTLCLKLIYSINHSLLSLFHALTSLLWLFDLASGLSSHFHFRSIVHKFTTISFICFTAYLCTQSLRMSLHQVTMVGFYRHFKYTHSFHSITSSHVHLCHCIYHSSHLHVRQLSSSLLLVYNIGLLRTHHYGSTVGST